mgnify:FL=1
MAAGKKSSPWARKGRAGSNAQAPGSYGGYLRERKPPSGYATTSQQKKIGEAGRAVGKECKGRTGGEWYNCRHGVLRGMFG